MESERKKMRPTNKNWPLLLAECWPSVGRCFPINRRVNRCQPMSRDFDALTAVSNRFLFLFLFWTHSNQRPIYSYASLVLNRDPSTIPGRPFAVLSPQLPSPLLRWKQGSILGSWNARIKKKHPGKSSKETTLFFFSFFFSLPSYLFDLFCLRGKLFHFRRFYFHSPSSRDPVSGFILSFLLLPFFFILSLLSPSFPFFSSRFISTQICASFQWEDLMGWNLGKRGKDNFQN